MSKPFDPYHKWLGIPAEDQPPNHYRLLGVRLFEDDQDVIEHAADQRMDHLRKLQAGEHTSMVHQLINKISGAKYCLLNLERREEYNRILHGQLRRPESKVASSVPIRCPLCGMTLIASGKIAGKAVRCPGCEEVIAIPTNLSRQDPAANLEASQLPTPPPPPSVAKITSPLPPPAPETFSSRAPTSERRAGKSPGVRFESRFFLLSIGVTLGVALLLVAGATIAYLAGWSVHQEEVSQPSFASPTNEDHQVKTEQPPEPEVQKTEQLKRKTHLPKEPTQHDVDSMSLVELVKKVEPSVVLVKITDPKNGGFGSGFVVSSSGVVVTNNHVMENANKAEVILHDGTKVEVKGYLKVSSEKDLAILQIDYPAEKLTPISIASKPPRKGANVAAFGSPLGFSRSVSDGIISAIRSSEDIKKLGLNFGLKATLVQTTAPISKGNSGGPLVNMKGEVVGVNTLNFTPFGGQNVNFAISAQDLKELLDEKGQGVSPLAPAKKSRIRQPSQVLRPQLVDLRFGPEGKVLLKKVQKVTVYVLVTGTPTTNNSEHLVRSSVEIILGNSNLGVVQWSKFKGFLNDPEIAVLLITLHFPRELPPEFSKLFPELPRQNLILKSEASLLQLDKDVSGTLSIALTWKETRQRYVPKRKILSEITRQSEIIARKLAITLGSKVKPERDLELEAANKLAMAKDLMKTNPRRAKERFQEIAREYVNRGYARFQTGELDKAIADFNEAIRLNPKYSDAYQYRGHAWKKKGDKAKAEADFKKAKELRNSP